MSGLTSARLTTEALKEGKVRVNLSAAEDGVEAFSILRREEPSPVDRLLTGLECLVVLLNLSLPDGWGLDVTWPITMRSPVSNERDDR